MGGEYDLPRKINGSVLTGKEIALRVFYDVILHALLPLIVDNCILIQSVTIGFVN